MIYPRSLHAQVNEANVVSHLLSDRRGPTHTMLDVGAHFGTTTAYFDFLGWTIYCFEPDPKNREKLLKRHGKKSNITIDARAISNTPARGVSFFTSHESTGISGLHAFRKTHIETGLVETTTLAHILDEKSIKHIDFLKIDVEGFDWNVLKGVPWNKIKPDVIVTEFEDAKTITLGHNYKEVCDYLLDRRYTVYLSEWHPLIRYGIPHDWHQVIKYPTPLANNDAWGNLLAFKKDPGLELLQNAFKTFVKFRKQKM